MSVARKLLPTILCAHFALLAVSPLWGYHACHPETSVSRECAPRCPLELERRDEHPDDDCLPESPIAHVIDAGLPGGSGFLYSAALVIVENAGPVIQPVVLFGFAIMPAPTTPPSLRLTSPSLPRAPPGLFC